MPLITRRSSTRGTPRGLFGSNGRSRVHCSSLNQNSPDTALSTSKERLNHIPAAMGILFMGPSPSERPYLTGSFEVAARLKLLKDVQQFERFDLRYRSPLKRLQARQMPIRFRERRRVPKTTAAF